MWCKFGHVTPHHRGSRVRLVDEILLAFFLLSRDIGMLVPNNQRQHRTLHIQKDELPYALC